MDELIRIVANYFIILPILIILYVFIKLPKKQDRINFIILIITGGILSLLIAKLGAYFIYDPRPFVVGHFTPLIAHVSDNGFPSDHTLFSSFLGFAILKYSKKFGIAILVIAVLIGAARILAGVHHLEDIIGSFVIAGIAVLIITWVMGIAHKSKNAHN
jgi:undecaprenyl-diphosphatase